MIDSAGACVQVTYNLPSYNPCDWVVETRVGSSWVAHPAPGREIPRVIHYTKVVYVCLVPLEQDGKKCLARLIFYGATYRFPDFPPATRPRDVDAEFHDILSSAETLASGEQRLPVRALLQYPDWHFEIEQVNLPRVEGEPLNEAPTIHEYEQANKEMSEALKNIVAILSPVLAFDTPVEAARVAKKEIAMLRTEIEYLKSIIRER